MTGITWVMRSINESAVARGFSMARWSERMANFVRVGCIVAAASLTYATVADADSHLIVKKSANSVSDTIDRLSDVLKARGISIVTRVDHAAGAAKSGLTLRPSTLLIFGNPKLGTPLMQSNPRVGLDLPMKVLVWQDEADRSGSDTPGPNA